MSRERHPAGRLLVNASVTWCGPVALIELVNKRGQIVKFRIEGPTVGTQIASVYGNDRGALVYDVEPGGRLTIVVDDGSRRVLYDGIAPTEVSDE